MSFDAKSGIMKAIAETQDQNLKTILLLLLGVLEELGGKIDAIAADEKGLREAVLNGHAENHDRDHEFVGLLFQHREAAAEERRWIRERMGSNCADACTWAEQRMRDEKDAAKTAVEDAKADKRAARDAIIRTVVASLTSAVITGLSVVAFLK